MQTIRVVGLFDSYPTEITIALQPSGNGVLNGQFAIAVPMLALTSTVPFTASMNDVQHFAATLRSLNTLLQGEARFVSMDESLELLLSVADRGRGILILEAVYSLAGHDSSNCGIGLKVAGISVDQSTLPSLVREVTSCVSEIDSE